MLNLSSGKSKNKDRKQNPWRLLIFRLSSRLSWRVQGKRGKNKTFGVKGERSSVRRRSQDAERSRWFVTRHRPWPRVAAAESCVCGSRTPYHRYVFFFFFFFLHWLLAVSRGFRSCEITGDDVKWRNQQKNKTQITPDILTSYMFSPYQLLTRLVTSGWRVIHC